MACDKSARKGIFASVNSTGCGAPHIQQNNPRGAVSLLRSALQRLEPHPGLFGGIAVSSLREEIHEWLQKPETGAAPPELAVPEIKLYG